MNRLSIDSHKSYANSPFVATAFGLLQNARWLAAGAAFICITFVTVSSRDPKGSAVPEFLFGRGENGTGVIDTCAQRGMMKSTLMEPLHSFAAPPTSKQIP